MLEAGAGDLDRIAALYAACTARLNEQGIFQWNERYPCIDTCIEGIKNRCQYVFENDGRLIGTVILNESQTEEWQPLPWRYTVGRALVIHAFAIDPTAQGKGYGQAALALCEAHGRRRGYSNMRLDAFPDNTAAIRLYEKNGYRKVGEVTFSFKPEGHQLFYCYDKPLTDRE
jgi:RimJ/RimL family protein N-acetyltransferase